MGGKLKGFEEWPVLTVDDRVKLGLARRPPVIEVTVASRHPEVLDMWADDNQFGPHEIAASSAVKVQWTCPKGHRFVESAVVQCSAVSHWRVQAGGSRACKSCYLGSMPDTTTLPCGHFVKARTSDEDQSDCWTCKQEERRQLWAQARHAAKSAPRYPVGTVIQSKSAATSSIERQVREKLVALGVQVHKGRSAIQCGREDGRDNFPILTPDILISKTKVCIEVDPAYTHAEKEATDRTRDRLLADAGWTVVRLRMGGLAPLGDYDVVAETENVTKDVIIALKDAIDDAVAGRPGTVRRVSKKEATRPAKKSRLGAIAAHKYYEDAFYVSWTMKSGGTARMVAMDSGRYLAVSEGWEVPRFICSLNLHQLPRSQWRATLEPLLESMEETGFGAVSTFPWGDELFCGEHADAIHLSPKFNLGGRAHTWTRSLIPGVDSYSDTSLSADGKVLAELHPDAVTRGWMIAEVRAQTSGGQLVQLIRRTDVDPEPLEAVPSLELG